jgi:hypothetical protein
VIDSIDNLEACYRRDPNIVSREVAGERILVPITKGTADMAAIYVLNETGGQIWHLMDGQHSLAEIRDLLVDEYDVAPDEAVEDLKEIVGQLQEIGAVRLA